MSGMNKKWRGLGTSTKRTGPSTQTDLEEESSQKKSGFRILFDKDVLGGEE